VIGHTFQERIRTDGTRLLGLEVLLGHSLQLLEEFIRDPVDLRRRMFRAGHELLHQLIKQCRAGILAVAGRGHRAKGIGEVPKLCHPNKPE
jgi:hypothetical protein